MNKKSLLSITFLLLIITACTEYIVPRVPIEIREVAKKTKKILFLGHTYESDYRVDKRIEQIRLQEYDYIWLGGDVCAKSDNRRDVLEYIDDLFDLDAPGHCWALGNHDVSSDNLHWVEELTGRNEFFTEHVDGLTLMTLNTNLYHPECDRLQEQFDMFKAVCDTIQESSHLILMSHHIIWDGADGIPGMWEWANANKTFWQSRCQPNSKFHQVLYQMLIGVQQRGVQVLFISGDYGQKDKTFQKQCNNGIWFIASGIDPYNRYIAKTEKDSILYLEHDPELRTLEWEFLDLDSMSKVWQQVDENRPL